MTNFFHSKRQPRTILSENSCHFVNLHSFASSSFFLSLRKITWLNSQQPKSRGHVEHHSILIILLHKTPQYWACYFETTKNLEPRELVTCPTFPCGIEKKILLMQCGANRRHNTVGISQIKFAFIYWCI